MLGDFRYRILIGQPAEAELSDDGCHLFDGMIVLAWVSGVVDQTINRPMRPHSTQPVSGKSGTIQPLSYGKSFFTQQPFT